MIFFIIRSGNNNTAPRKKQTAPANVPKFVRVKLNGKPVLGETYEAIADTPNAIDPIKLSATILHDILEGFKDQKPFPTSIHAR